MPLNYHEVCLFAESSAAIRLIRGKWCAEDIAFLMHTFRNSGTIVLGESELKTAMIRWMEINFSSVPEKHPGWNPIERIAYYVHQVFLKKREPLGLTEPTYELTAEIDRLLTWVEDQRHREFVGTEYGLQAIIRDLHELSAHASGNWQKRVDSLELRRKKIQEEIEFILSNAGAADPNPRYILENLQRLERASQELISDFSVLRERFAELTRDIARQHGGVSARRGDMLRLALDGEDALRKTPMGESFYGFWRLVASSERDAFIEMLETIYATPSLPEEVRERRLLLSLLDRLRDQGQVVLDANRQLTRQLRRALDQEEIEIRQIMASRVNELRLLLLGHRDEMKDIVGILVDERAAINLPLERPNFDPPEPIVIETTIQPATLGDISDAADQIVQAGLVNFKRLVQNIQNSLEASRPRTGVLLSSVLDRYPPQEGILDILGYLHIARMVGEEDAEVMEKNSFRWRSINSARELICPDVFFISVEKAKP